MLEPTTATIETTQGEIKITAMKRKEFVELQKISRGEDTEAASEYMNSIVENHVVQGRELLDDIEAREWLELVKTFQEISMNIEKN